MTQVLMVKDSITETAWFVPELTVKFATYL
jgi:hypothetical protein